MKRTEKTHIKSFAQSHPGMSGKNNEDRFGVSAFLMEDANSTQTLLAVLSDGIGGHRAGEVASEMVVDHVSKTVADSDAKDPLRILQQAAQNASNLIHARAANEEGRKGMGATLACAWIIGQRLYTATVGDSRIYLVRSGKIKQLSIDHSWIQEAIESGVITPEQAVGHPNAHVIRRYMGSKEPPEIDFRLQLNENESREKSVSNQGMMLQNDDRLLLCSDGLTDLVSDDEIRDFLLNHSIEDATQMLIDLANERGGHDNITIIALHVPPNTYKGVLPVVEGRKLPVRNIAIGCGSLVILALLVLGGIFGYNWLIANREIQPTNTDSPDKMTNTPVVEMTETNSPEEAVPQEVESTVSITVTETPQSETSNGGEEESLPQPVDDSEPAVPTNTLTPGDEAAVTETATVTATP